MKKQIAAVMLASSLTLGASAAPFLAAGDGAEIFLTAMVGVQADDNIYLSNTATDDTVLNFNPGVEFKFGENAQTKGTVKAGVNITSYADNDQLNTELVNLSFNSTYDDGKTKFTTAVSFVEMNQNTFDIRGLTRRDATNLKLGGETSITEKSSIGADVAYSKTDYKVRTGYSDLTTVTIPLTYYYEVSEKVDLTAGFRYRDTDNQTSPDSKDYAYRLGFRGEFTPKVTGSLAAGFGTREFDGGGDETGLDLDASLSFLLTEKTTLQVTANNDFGNSGSGAEQKTFSLGGNLSIKATDQWTFRAGTTMRKLDYYTREDDYMEFNLGADYVVNEYVSIQGAYAFRKYDSALAGSDFKNNVFSIAANLRY